MEVLEEEHSRQAVAHSVSVAGFVPDAKNPLRGSQRGMGPDAQQPVWHAGGPPVAVARHSGAVLGQAVGVCRIP